MTISDLNSSQFVFKINLSVLRDEWEGRDEGGGGWEGYFLSLRIFFAGTFM